MRRTDINTRIRHEQNMWDFLCGFFPSGCGIGWSDADLILYDKDDNPIAILELKCSDSIYDALGYQKFLDTGIVTQNTRKRLINLARRCSCPAFLILYSSDFSEIWYRRCDTRDTWNEKALQGKKQLSLLLWEIAKIGQNLSCLPHSIA